MFDFFDIEEFFEIDEQVTVTGKFGIDDEFDGEMRIVDFVDRFLERFREKFLRLGEDEFIRNAENDRLILFVQIKDPYLAEEREDLLMILLLREMQERSLPYSAEQRLFFCIVLFYHIDKHGSVLRSKVAVYDMFYMFGKLFVRIQHAFAFLRVFGGESLGRQKLGQIRIGFVCNKFFQIFNE